MNESTNGLMTHVFFHLHSLSKTNKSYMISGKKGRGRNS